MRDINQMIDLLEEMDNDPGGFILVRNTLNMSSAQRKRYHHAELLTDAGLALQKSDSGFRITNGGYDFLNAVKQDRPKYIAKAKELLEQGKSLLDVVAQVISIVNGLSD